ncbi:MAG TPA: hypothetical protein VII38_15730 [Polyangia bacterium]|jgi:hypothetical protein
MRALSFVVVLGFAFSAAAQEPAPSPQPSVPVQASPTPTPLPDTPTLTLHSPRPVITPQMASRWRGARTLYIFGDLIGLAGTGLSLSSAIYVFATGYPPSADDFVHPAKASDTGPVLAEVGAAASAVGFAMSAGGLGWQHHLLDELGADRGRGLFIGGTAVGVIGLVAVAASYFFGFTNYLNPHDRTVAALSTSLGGAALCATGSLLYSVDSSRVKQVWRDLTSF